MTPEQNLRMKALDLAVRVVGNPNHTQLATSFLEFIKAGDRHPTPDEQPKYVAPAPEETVEETVPAATTVKPTASKGTRK
jgi:hypothetical protein